MPTKHDDSPKKDLRVMKTQQALIEAMLLLVKEKRFSKITVNSICQKGLISRATFYSHYSDKYDLLEHWLLTLWTCKISKADTYEELEVRVNQFVRRNEKVLKNLFLDADEYTLEKLLCFLCSVFNIDNTKRINGRISQKNAVGVNLYMNGIVNYLLWQAKNNFPLDVPMINPYSFDAIKKLWDWARE